MPVTSAHAPVLPSIIEFGAYRLDTTLRLLWRNSEPVKLTPKPFSVLEFLIANRHRVVGKEELRKAIWGEERGPNVVEQTVRHMRLALQADPTDPQFIVTVPGTGYRFVGIREEERDIENPPEPLPAPGVRSVFRFSKAYAIAGAIVCLFGLVAAVALFRHSSQQEAPARISFTRTAVEAWDAGGRHLWNYDFGKTLDLKYYRSLAEFVRIGDLRGDGEVEVLVAAPYLAGPNPQNMFDVELACLSSTGRLLWTYFPRRTLRFGEYDLRRPWYLFDLLISRRGPKHPIYAAFAHHLWGNSFIVELDPVTGKDTLRYVNTGTIRSLNELQVSRKTYLLAGGFNNEHDGASLGVIDEAKPFAASPQTRGTRHACTNCPAGAPDYYFVFARSELNRFAGSYEVPVDDITVSENEVHTFSHEMLGRRNGVRSIHLFRADPAIHPVSLRFDTDYDLLHKDLELHHKLDHSLAACPERLHPAPVKVWTPSEGWKELQIRSSR